MFHCKVRYVVGSVGWYTKGQVEWLVWMSYIYWCSKDTIQNMCARARERERDREWAHNGEKGLP